MDGGFAWSLRPLVVEVHPEISFALLNGAAAVMASKRRAAGRRERAILLARQFEGLDELIGARPPGAHPDDVLDAVAALWTARRVRDGRAMHLGGEIDARGLTMAIWA